jgi:hypothetical protein
MTVISRANRFTRRKLSAKRPAEVLFRILNTIFRSRLSTMASPYNCRIIPQPERARKVKFAVVQYRIQVVMTGEETGTARRRAVIIKRSSPVCRKVLLLQRPPPRGGQLC